MMLLMMQMFCHIQHYACFCRCNGEPVVSCIEKPWLLSVMIVYLHHCLSSVVYITSFYDWGDC